MRKKSHSIQRKRLISQQKHKVSARRHVQFIQENQSLSQSITK
ncbi:MULTISPECIES: hypothetical protein [Thalassotalea]|uniref:Uncharacterized protein n=1 Tax=Thalassotalea castellviae TaxID=3075612 RepID=A0ABU2ZXN9_9GAMM|nr:hypothetical protein [Thalassotalea sp. W431]MDT0602388.1 hypothetical protein [Thalassotalea sp. W431]